MFVYRLFLLEQGLYFSIKTLLRPNLDYQPEDFKGGELQASPYNYLP